MIVPMIYGSNAGAGEMPQRLYFIKVFLAHKCIIEAWPLGVDGKWCPGVGNYTWLGVFMTHACCEPQFWLGLVYISGVLDSTQCSMIIFVVSEEWPYYITVFIIIISNTDTSIGAL